MRPSTISILLRCGSDFGTSGSGASRSSRSRAASSTNGSARWARSRRSSRRQASSSMAAVPPAPDPRATAACLDDADLELDPARRLIADPPNRLAAFHLQQASEKLVKAVRLSHGLRVTADHDLEALIDELPHNDPWHAKLRVLEPLSAYATTYRYP